MTKTNTTSNYSLTRFDTSSDTMTFTYNNPELGSTVVLEIETGPGAGAVVLHKGERLSGMMIDDVVDFIFHNGDILN